MTKNRSLWPLYFLQFIPLLLYKPENLQGFLPLIVLVVALYILLGYALIRGRTWALTLSIFVQGINVIVRLMMLYPNAKASATSPWDFTYIAINLLSIALSIWLLLRLDQPDVRSTMVA